MTDEKDSHTDEVVGLVRQAQKGDRVAFDRLLAMHESQLRGVVRKIVGHPDDSEDIIQEAMVKAWNGIGGFRLEAAFSTWLTKIAMRSALDFLRKQKRWRAQAQIAYANLCAESEELGGEVMAQFAAPDFSYEVREHIAYCFTCVGRSLPPDEIAALILRDVVGMSAAEACDVLGITDSVLRHRLAAARKSMSDQYEGLCTLVSKTGMCHQCKGLQMAAAEGKKGGAFPDIADFAARCAVVRDCKTTGMKNLHDVFWRRTAEIESKGLGDTEPQSDCGHEDDSASDQCPAEK